MVRDHLQQVNYLPFVYGMLSKTFDVFNRLQRQSSVRYPSQSLLLVWGNTHGMFRRQIYDCTSS